MAYKRRLPESRNIIFFAFEENLTLLTDLVLVKCKKDLFTKKSFFSAVNRNNMNYSCHINQKYFCTRLILPITELTVLSSFER